jgi:hypothetical protein
VKQGLHPDPSKRPTAEQMFNGPGLFEEEEKKAVLIESNDGIQHLLKTPSPGIMIDELKEP